MAVIPAGNFGSRVAGTPNSVQVPEQATIGPAFTELANKIGEVHQRQAAKVRDSADRAAAITATGQISDALTAAHDATKEGIRSGTISKADAVQQFRDTSKSIIDGAVDAVSEEHRAIVAAQAQDDTGRLANNLQRAIYEQDRNDISANLIAQAEQATRNPRLLGQLKSALDTLGPNSAMDEIQRGALLQHTKETIARDQALAVTESGRFDLAANTAASKRLADPKFLPDLDPTQRQQQLNYLDNYAAQIKNHAEVEESKRINAAMRLEAHQAATYSLAITQVPQLGARSADWVNHIQDTLKGSLYEEPFKAAINDARENGAVTSRPIPAQLGYLQATRAAYNANPTPQTLAQVNKVEKLVDSNLKLSIEDPVKGAALNGLFEPAQIDFTSGSTIKQALPGMIAQSQSASAWKGDVAPLMTGDQAKVLADRASALEPADRAEYLAPLVAASPQQISETGKLIARNKGDHSVAMGVMVMAHAGTRGGKLYFAGVDAMRRKLEKSGTDNSLVAGGDKAKKILDQLKGAYTTKASMDAVTNATLGVWAGLQQEGVSENAALTQAIDIVTGGIIDHNGKTVKPYGMSDGEFKDHLSAITPDDIKAMAGGGQLVLRTAKGVHAISPEQVVQSIHDARLSGDDGRYNIHAGGGVMEVSGGGRFWLDFNQIGKHVPRGTKAQYPTGFVAPELPSAMGQ
jgi:hypothetical protein